MNRKDNIIKALQKRESDAFSDGFHNNEKKRIGDAINTIIELVPPECFESCHKQELKKMSWNTVKEKYLKFHKMDKFTEDMAIDIDFGYWLLENAMPSKDAIKEALEGYTEYIMDEYGLDLDACKGFIPIKALEEYLKQSIQPKESHNE